MHFSDELNEWEGDEVASLNHHFVTKVLSDICRTDMTRTKPLLRRERSLIIRRDVRVVLWFILFLLCLLCQVSDAGRKNLGRKLIRPRKCREVNFGIIYPNVIFHKRDYQRVVKEAVADEFESLTSATRNVCIKNITVALKVYSSPTSILSTLCDKFLPHDVSAIIFISNSQTYDHNIATWRYFLQLAGYLGLPVIGWNADNSGLEQAAAQGLRIQLAPSINHQTAAMLSILVLYRWHSFAILTSQIAGHLEFVQSVEEQVALFGDNPQGKFRIIESVLLSKNPREGIAHLAKSEARVILLYSTQEEAALIMKEANEKGLTGSSYIWIVTQSVIGDRNSETSYKVPDEFPVGMLGVNFDTSTDVLFRNIQTAIKVVSNGVELFLNETRNKYSDLKPKQSCFNYNRTSDSSGIWLKGTKFHRCIKNVVVNDEAQSVSFNEDGTRQDVELKIVNLRKGKGNSKLWEEIGVWRSWEDDGLTVNDIVWPGNSHVAPPGVPDMFYIKIAFLEEPPYIDIANADPETHECSANRGLPCQVPNDTSSGSVGNSTYVTKCCSGFCIDLLKKFANDLRFSFDLVRVEDGQWGTYENGRWNGLIGELTKREGKGADMVLTSLKVNKEREGVVDFTVPFLESGMALLVAKRTGIISPTAFLEPFDAASWMLVALVAIHVAAMTIFIFEWLSPDGYNMKMAPPRDHKFSLFRTYWLVWAVLFQAAVHVDCPRGFTARFMANMWAMFAVVFLAIYTANLAAFMITREEFHDFTGLNDTRLQNPFTVKPPVKYGTVPKTNAASVMRRHHPTMWDYMQTHKNMRTSVKEGIKSIKNKELDAFIYDATVLDYWVGQDEDCQILTVGTWYAMTGYGLAFPRGSKHVAAFDKQLMFYKENGDIERLQRFWLTGTCKPKKQERRASEPLAIEQFLSAYLLLIIGIVLAFVLLFIEHIYFKYIRKMLAKKDSGGCCALVSLSMGKSLTFRGAVYEAQDRLRRHRCMDPVCDNHRLKFKYELDTANFRIQQLEKQLQSKWFPISPTLRTVGSSLRFCSIGPQILCEGVRQLPSAKSSMLTVANQSYSTKLLIRRRSARASVSSQEISESSCTAGLFQCCLKATTVSTFSNINNTPIVSPHQFHRPLQHHRHHHMLEEDDDEDKAIKLQQISKQFKEHQLKQQQMQQQQFQSTGSARSTTSSVFFSDDQNLLLGSVDSHTICNSSEKLISVPSSVELTHQPYTSSSVSTQRLGLESPDSMVDVPSDKHPSSSLKRSRGGNRASVVASKSSSSHAHILSSSKSLLSLFGSKAAAEKIPIDEGSNSASYMVEFRHKRPPPAHAGDPFFPSNIGMRSSTTVLDSLRRRDPPLFPNAAPSSSTRSGRIGFDSLTRNPMVDHRLASNVHSQPLIMKYPQGSQTLKHPTARSTKSGLYQSFNVPLSSREDFYKRRRSFDDDDINLNEDVPHNLRHFPMKPRRCK